MVEDQKIDIDIFSIVGKNGKFCSEFLRKSMLSLSRSKNKLHFKAIMNSSDPPKKWEIQEFIPKFEHTSLNHTIGINRIKQYVTSPYLLVCDTDTVVLCQDWDIRMIDAMKNLDVDVLGVNNWNSPFGYQGFPTVTFFLTTRESFLRSNVDFRPSLQVYPNRLGIGCTTLKISEYQAKIINRPKEFLLRQDSGWQFPFSYHKHGYKGDVLDKVSSPGGIILEVSQMWKLNEEPIVCHLGKSTRRGMKRISQWYKSVHSYIEKQ